MGIETSAEHGGAEASFMSAILAIEELARIDPSVSVVRTQLKAVLLAADAPQLCDVHNTLVNTIFRKYGTQEQRDKFLPMLAESKVS